MTSRAGRPTVIAGERGRPDDGRPDLRSRVAWLARTSRCAAADTVLHRQAAFAQRLAETGLRVSASRISMWENGHQAMSLDALRGYEQVLDLPCGSMQATALGLLRGLTRRGRVPVALPRRDLTAAAAQRQLDEVYDTAVRGRCRGHEWFALALYWHCSPRAMTPLAIVRQLTSILVDEMARSVGVAYVTRYQALCLLADHPVYARVVAERVLDFAREPGAGPVTDVIGVLGESSEPSAATDLIRLARAAEGRVRAGAVQALMTLVTLGNLPPDGVVPTVQLCQMLLAGSPGEVRLGHQLAEPLRVRGAEVGLAPSLNRQSPPSMATAVVTAYAEDARRRTGLPHDPVLLQLLREAHTVEMPQVRHHVALLLMASPYRRALADRALQIALGDHGQRETHCAAWLLTYLAGPEHVSGLLAGLRSVPAPLHSQLLVALAHAEGVPPDLDLGAWGEPAWDSAAIYAAGMSNHHLLDRWADHAGEEGVRTACLWWRRHGPAVREG